MLIFVCSLLTFMVSYTGTALLRQFLISRWVYPIWFLILRFSACAAGISNLQAILAQIKNAEQTFRHRHALCAVGSLRGGINVDFANECGSFLHQWKSKIFYQYLIDSLKVLCKQYLFSIFTSEHGLYKAKFFTN